MTALRAFGKSFGHNAFFEYPEDSMGNPDPEIWVDDSLGEYGLRPYLELLWVSREMNIISEYWDIAYDFNRINIYFGPTVSIAGVPPTVQLAGFGWDPRDSVSSGSAAPYVFIMDADYGSGPTVIYSDHILEHEMGHSLLRKDNTGGYDQGEHDPTLNASHLMKPLAPYGQISSDDAQRCSQRVLNNAYLFP